MTPPVGSSGVPSPAALPAPSAEALGHSESLVTKLRESISQSGPLSFSDYMQQVLYSPGMGYYTSGNTIFGRAGDFTTAPESSRLFGRCLANQLAQVIEQTGGDVLEFGGGSGALAADVMLAMAEQGRLPDHYFILEPSASLQQTQESHLRHHLDPKLFDRVTWLGSLPDRFTGVVIANEVLDAMPVDRFQVDQDGRTIRQVVVDWTENGLTLALRPAESALSKRVQQRLGHVYDDVAAIRGYRSEVSCLIQPWVSALSQSMVQGLVLVIDYGYPRREYYLPERCDGTVRCYYRHHCHDDVLLYPGLQDITSDVDFTLVAEAGCNADFDLHGFTSQAQFLLACGLIGLAEQAQSQEDESERIRISQQVNDLTGVRTGDRFHVMALSKGLEIELQGFASVDMSHRL